MSVATAIPPDYSECFRKHCRLYYQTSLSISDNSNYTCTNSGSSEDKIQASRVVLDALEHQLGNAPDTELSNDHRDFLKSERAKKYENELRSSGLYIGIEEIGQYCSDDEQPVGKVKSYYKPQEILLEYSKVKDEERRLAHITKMKERRETLHNLFLKHSGDAKSTSTRFLGEFDVTTQKYLTHVCCRVQKFVCRYKNNIGSHSLLAGIGRIVKEQIKMNDEVCFWSFNSSVISESCFGSLQNQDGKSYMEDAVSVLTSFLIYNPEQDIEANDDGDTEEFITFHVHPMISNSFLKYILAEIPSSLDAKPTGRCGSRESSNQPLVRANLTGQFDESAYLSIVQWTKSFCEIL